LSLVSVQTHELARIIMHLGDPPACCAQTPGFPVIAGLAPSTNGRSIQRPDADNRSWCSADAHSTVMKKKAGGLLLTAQRVTH
jgi:hypothetical protein